MTMEPHDIRQLLRTALVYSFMLHNYPHEQAVALAEIAIEPCAETMLLCAKIMQINLEELTWKPH